MINDWQTFSAEYRFAERPVTYNQRALPDSKNNCNNNFVFYPHIPFVARLIYVSGPAVATGSPEVFVQRTHKK